MAPVVLGTHTALDTHINGSVGEFKVSRAADGAEHRALTVRYMLSHVTLSTSGGMQNKVLQQLAPVREVFPLERLELDELMQRDLNDSRVSTELIPYLLEHASTGLVKLFPPIIVVIMPIDDRKLPATHYPAVKEFDETNEGHTFRCIRSGAPGEEVFQFKQYLTPDGTLDPYNNATLSINQNRTRLVIVDGQHRAMALIAMFRNKTSWPTGAKARYEPYYRQWSESRLAEYDFGDLQLPVMYCTFPELHENTESSLKVKDACRSVFLALNKNARAVSDSRNKVLDDRNLIATFMRALLTEVKNTEDRKLRMWHIRLEHPKKQKLPGAASVSSVLWIYGAIEQLLLSTANPGGAGGLSQPTENLHLVKTIEDACQRLNARNTLGLDRCRSIRRESFSEDDQQLLTELFMRRFGGPMVALLGGFGPYRALYDSSNEMRVKLENQEHGPWYQDLLSADITEPVRLLTEDFKGKNVRLSGLAAEIRAGRDGRFIGELDKADRERLLEMGVVRKLYETLFLTAAFQWALIFTFFRVLEAVDLVKDQAWDTARVDSLRESFLGALNDYFSPQSLPGMRALVQAFLGKLSGQGSNLQFAPTDSSLRAILESGELKPDSWPKIRFILVEIWLRAHEDGAHSVDQDVADELRAVAGLCRVSAHRAHFNRLVRSEATEVGVSETEIRESVQRSKRLDRRSREELTRALKHLGVVVDAASLPSLAASAPGDAESISAADEDAETGEQPFEW